MVQVFGNRILGGIGAPGGGMSESFGAGVNTALNQRASRQAMVGEGQRQSILAQEQAFRIEDRAAAKKRQAAAEAAAATARARTRAILDADMRIYGTLPTTNGLPGLGLGAPRVAPSGLDNVPVGGLPAGRPPAAPAVNISANARPAASGAVNISAGARPVTGGAGGGVTGGAGSDTLGAGVRVPGAQGFEQRTGRPAAGPAAGTMLGAQGFERRAGLPADLDAYLSRTESEPTGNLTADLVAAGMPQEAAEFFAPLLDAPVADAADEYAKRRIVAAYLEGSGAIDGSATRRMLDTDPNGPIFPLRVDGFGLMDAVNNELTVDGRVAPQGSEAWNEAVRLKTLIEAVRRNPRAAVLDFLRAQQPAEEPAPVAGVKVPPTVAGQPDVSVGQLPAAGVKVSTTVAGRPDVAVGQLPAPAEPLYSNTLGVELSMDGQGKLLMNGKRVPANDPMYEEALRQYTSLQQNRQMPAAPVAPAVSAAPSAVGEPVFSMGLNADLSVDGQGNLLMDGEVMSPDNGLYPAVSKEYKRLRQEQVLAAEQALRLAGESPRVFADPLDYRTGVADAQQALLDAQTAVGAAPNEYARFAGRSDAPVGALPPAPTVTIQGPKGPVTVSAVAEPGAGGTLALQSAGAAGAEGFEQRYGPSLGAPTRTPEEAEVDEFIAPTGVDPNAKPPPKMAKPGAPQQAIVILLSEREKHVQYTQALIDAGAYEEALAMRAIIEVTDIKLEAAVARQAIEEARDYYAPQRLNAIWSGKKNRNFEFVPTAEGIYDVYVDGQLQFPGMSMEQITQDTLAMTDQVYAEQQAALAQKEAEAFATASGTARGEYPFELQGKLDTANIDTEKQTLLAELAVTQDFGIKENQLKIERLAALTGQVDPDDIEIEKTDEGFVIFNKRTGRPVSAYMLTDMRKPTTGEMYKTYVEVLING